MADLTKRRRPAIQLVDEIANIIRDYKPALILRVGVDGVDGVGKTVFADTLARAVEAQGRAVIRASVDGFHNPRKDRYWRGGASPEGFYLDSYDYAGLKRRLLDPLGPHGSRIYCSAIFDNLTDAPLPMRMLLPIRLPSSSSMGFSFTGQNSGMSGTYPFSWMRHLT